MNRLLLVLTCFLFSCQNSVHQVEGQSSKDRQPASYVGGGPNSFNKDEQVFRLRLNSTLSQALGEHGIHHRDIHSILVAAKPHRNLSMIRAGTPFHILREKGPIETPVGVMFQFSAIESLAVFKNEEGAWASEKIQEKVDFRKVTFAGVVETSLWESAQEADMDPNLIAELTEIFAWQVDFSREVRDGDRWRLVVEQKLVNGQSIGWGRILAAEYQNQGDLYTAVLFRKENRDKGYFFPDGRSLRRMFLKSPIRFGRISSRFRYRRFHPILKKSRPHLGVDYAAPRGTPVRAVGAGRVSYMGWRGGGGKTIKLRHNSVYRTAYKHLSRYAKGIHPGVKVEQGQVIGYVGSTGLATGPHLHFEFFENGRFVDPLGRKFPSAGPVAKKDLEGFQAHAELALGDLPLWFRPGITPLGPHVASSR